MLIAGISSLIYFIFDKITSNCTGRATILINILFLITALVTTILYLLELQTIEKTEILLPLNKVFNGYSTDPDKIAIAQKSTTFIKNKLQSKFHCCGYDSIIDYCEDPEHMKSQVIEPNREKNENFMREYLTIQRDNKQNNQKSAGQRRRKRREVEDDDGLIKVGEAASEGSGLDAMADETEAKNDSNSSQNLSTMAKTDTTTTQSPTTTQPPPTTTLQPVATQPPAPIVIPDQVLDFIKLHSIDKDKHQLFTFDDLATHMRDEKCNVKTSDVCPNLNNEDYHFENHGCKVAVVDYYVEVINSFTLFTYGLGGLSILLFYLKN